MRYASRDKRPLAEIAIIDQATIDQIASQVTPPNMDNYVLKELGKSLVADLDIPKIHAPGSDNQDLSGLALANDPRFTDARVPLTHVHDYEPANVNIQAHVISAHAPATAQKNSDITKAEIEAKLTGAISTHTHAGGSDPWTVVKLGDDFVSSLATNANVTNFYFTPQANKTYLIFGYFLLRTATATVGARPGVAWPSGLTDGILRAEASNSLTTSGIRLWGAKTTQNAASTGLATTTDSHWGSIDGIMITAANVSGNFQITLASETAGTNVTMKAGSILMYREL